MWAGLGAELAPAVEEHSTVWELLGQGLQVNLCNACVSTEPGIPQSTWSYIGHNKRSK